MKQIVWNLYPWNIWFYVYIVLNNEQHKVSYHLKIPEAVMAEHDTQVLTVLTTHLSQFEPGTH